MRLTLLFLLITLPAFSEEILLTDEQSTVESAAVIIGLVRDTCMIQTNEYDGIWRANVEIQSTLKQDTNLPKRVFIYYEQELRPDSGRRCPPYPRVAIGDKTKFWCTREDIEGLKQVLFLPSGSWMRWLDRNFAVRKP